jgi:hypothetical protein
MAWGLLMPSNTEHHRSRTHLASVLRLLFVPVALLVSFHTEPVSADSPSVVLIAAPSENASVDAGISAEAELPLCDRADGLLAVAPGLCAAVVPEAMAPEVVPPEGVTPDLVARGAQEEAVKAPADPASAPKAAPMCATDATSIAAPVEIPEVDRGNFEPLPCDVQALLALFRSPSGEGSTPLIAARELPHHVPSQSPASNDGNDGNGALLVPPYWPEGAAPSTLDSHRSVGLAWQPGHRSRIDRPPSLRGSSPARARTTPA